MKNMPLEVEIVAYAPTAFYHCTHCEVAWQEIGASNQIHEEQVRSSLPPDLANDFQLISDWVRDTFRLYCDRVTIKVIDAASIEGFIKSIHRGLHRYPAVLIENKKYSGREALEMASHDLAFRFQTEEARNV